MKENTRIIFKGNLYIPIQKFDGKEYPDLQYIKLDDIIRQMHEAVDYALRLRESSQGQQQTTTKDSKIGIA